MNDPTYDNNDAALGYASTEIERLRAKVAETAAFLDGLADRLDNKGSKPEGFYVPAQDRTLRQAAADCRARAERLRK
jgi:hypothetical protein